MGLRKWLYQFFARRKFQDMGCPESTLKESVRSKGVRSKSVRSKSNRRWFSNVGEVCVFVPGLRVPKNIDFHTSLSNRLPMSLVKRLSDLRSRIVVMAAQEVLASTKRRRRTATQLGDSSLSDLLQALEQYLPVLLGLVEDGGQLKDRVSFVWANQEDDAEETSMADAWYEVLSVLHLMSMLCFLEANSMLLIKSTDGYYSKVSEDARCKSLDILLKAAGYLDCAIRIALPRIPDQLRHSLPIDLSEDVLHALCLQAMGQGVYIQLVMAIDNPKATLAVKRRLACEMVKYWNQADESIKKVRILDGWGQKHKLFLEWKYAEAKAAAYYYHGIILDEFNVEKSHAMAVASLMAAEEFLKECKRARESFHATPPISRNPSLLSSLKCLSEKLPKDASNTILFNQELRGSNKAVPELPDFVLSLAPDDYQLPPSDPAWKEQSTH